MYLFISSFKKKIKVLGFAYENDIIRVSQSKINLQTIKVDTTHADTNHICSFYATFNYYTFRDKANLVIEVDSGNKILLDTIVVLTEKNKKPFISFENPRETKFKRKFFLGDDTDKRFYFPD